MIDIDYRAATGPFAKRALNNTWSPLALKLVEYVIDEAGAIFLDLAPVSELPSPPHYGNLWLELPSPKVRRRLMRQYPKLERLLSTPGPVDLSQVLLNAEFCLQIGTEAHSNDFGPTKYRMNLKVLRKY